MKGRLWVIEKRDEAGKLDFSSPQPEQFYGLDAITGIEEDRMAETTFLYEAPGNRAVLTGQNIAQWPAFVHPRFIARRRTW